MKSVSKFIMLLLLCVSATAQAYTIRRLANADGLTNSAVLSVCQTQDGFMWFGTCDGMSFYDGVKIRPYGDDSSTPLCGNLIENFETTGHNNLWVMTNYGLTYIDGRSTKVLNFPEFQHSRILRKNDNETVFVLTRDNSVSYYITGVSERFKELKGIELSHRTIIDIIPCNDRIYLVSAVGIACYDLKPSGTDELLAVKKDNVQQAVSNCFYDDDNVFLISPDNMLYIFDTATGRPEPVLDVSDYTMVRGDVSDVSYSHDKSLFVAFKNDGILKFTAGNQSISSRFSVEDIGIRGGIFCLKRDRFQDILWVGSDGQGVFMVANDNCTIKMISYAQIANSIISPVRSIFMDDSGSLWLGSKGDGLVRIKHFDPTGSEYFYDFDKYTMLNSGLLDNSVYALARSRRRVLWIGTEKGLNYYSYESGHVCSIDAPDYIRYIHSIYEENDSTLWLASVGNGIIKATIGGTPSQPVIVRAKQYVIEDGDFTSNFFFTLATDDAGNMYFGNRGFGVLRLKDDRLMPVKLKNSYNTRIVNDAFAIIKTDTTTWIGTGYGLIRHTNSSEKLYSDPDGMPRSAIHTMERDNMGNLWIASNKGLTCLDTATGRTRNYDHLNGLEVTEFSDGASYATNDMLFFGGINGVAVISAMTGSVSSGYTPAISFTQLRVNGQDVSLRSRYSADDGYKLVLNPEENSFKIWFNAPDHINGSNYVY